MTGAEHGPVHTSHADLCAPHSVGGWVPIGWTDDVLIDHDVEADDIPLDMSFSITAQLTPEQFRQLESLLCGWVTLTPNPRYL